MKKATVEKVIEIINATIEKEEISYKNIDKKLSDMGIDSIAFIQIIVALEEELECEIPDSKLLMSELDTVQKISDVLEGLQYVGMFDRNEFG